jgi:CheY-like chemotaxis protein
VASYRHPADKPEQQAVRVLIAEDEAMIALTLCDLLEADGYEVTLTSDGAEALTAARHLGSTLDALLTDLNMPCMRGEELIRALRILRPSLPVVVLTGSPPPGGSEELRQHGGGDGPLILLHKPIDYTGLSDMEAGTCTASASPSTAASRMAAEGVAVDRTAANLAAGRWLR